MLKAQLPFLRAYSPSLADHGITPRDFVAFIDNLALAQAPPQALRALNLVGTGFRFVPLHTVQLAGAGLAVAVGVGTAIVTRTRTQKFMEIVNQQFFGPRGLRASILNNAELVLKLGLSSTMPPVAYVCP
jgi:hypothetical protein